MATIQNGIITTDFNSYGDGASSVIIQPDGKILVAGSSNNGTDSDFALVRYNSNGSLDTSFSGDGKVTTAISFASSDYSRLMSLQSDGKILLFGSSTVSGGKPNLAIVRYNSDGSIDTSFSGDGKITTDTAFFSSIAAMTTQADGKVLVAGTYYDSASTLNYYYFALARYNSDGSLDISFSSDGEVFTTFPYTTHNSHANSITVQADGKILVAGTDSSIFCLARYNSDGSLDTSFSVDGRTTYSGSTGLAGLSKVIVQPDGKILAIGHGVWVGFILLRYNADGTLDTNFDGDGVVTTGIFANSIGNFLDSPSSVIVQPDGKLVVAGYSYNSSGYADFTLVRYNSNGSLDTSFDSDGKVITGIGSANDAANSVIAQPDGKLVVVGSSNNDGSTTGSDFAVVRYNSDGSLDSTFTGLDKGFTITPLDGLITNESGNSIRFSVSMNTQPNRDVSVTFSSGDSSEGAVTNAPLTFTATNWTTPQTFSVVGQDDTLVDGNITYQITAAVNTIDVNYSGLILSPLTLTNNDNEEAGKIIKGDVGGSQSDVLVGGGGDDTIYGFNLKDDLSGGLGNDTLYGGSDNDVLFGEDGNDNLYGEQGNDYMDGGAGNDILNGSIGIDTMIGGLGNDSYYVDNISDVVTETSTLATEIDKVNSSISYILNANAENLILTGTAAINGTGNISNNSLTGNAAANSLNGDAGADKLLGGAGNDILIGGVGKDTLTGGTGADKFKFAAVSETGMTATTRDTITDFKTVQADKIDLSTIDANTTVAANNAFVSFNQGAAFSGSFAVSAALFFDQTTHILWGNNDTDATADFSILLTGVTSLTTSDFIL